MALLMSQAHARVIFWWQQHSVKTWQLLPDVLSPLPRKKKKKCGWLARLAKTLDINLRIKVDPSKYVGCTILQLKYLLPKLCNGQEETMDYLQSEYQVADVFILNSISSAQFAAGKLNCYCYLYIYINYINILYKYKLYN